MASDIGEGVLQRVFGGSEETDGLDEEELEEVANCLATQHGLDARDLALCLPRTAQQVRGMIDDE